MYFDGSVTCEQPMQYLITTVLIIHVWPFFLAVMVSRSLLEKDKIGVTQFFLAYILPLHMLTFWFFVWMRDLFQKVRTWEQLKARISKHFKISRKMVNSTEMDAEYDLHVHDAPSLSTTDNPIDNIVQQSNHDSDDSALIPTSNQDEHSVKAEILLVVSEPYVKHDNPNQSVLYWEGILMLRLLILTLCILAYRCGLATTTRQTAALLIFLIWHVYKQLFGSRGPNNLDFLPHVSDWNECTAHDTGYTLYHGYQGTRCYPDTDVYN